jgi:hypothetical protein
LVFVLKRLRSAADSLSVAPLLPIRMGVSRSLRLLSPVGVSIAVATTAADAQIRTPDLFTATLEELMRIEVTQLTWRF